ncbi:hypothetical protein Syn7803US95_155 [Synechococcus phage ACG-2014d]|uniref:Gp185 n=1 Tax=Synechococcus phage ACG-2014d TaxID=1493509 RepID=A0A0E3FYE9_9CAUD|nr:hypothetical protein Syn7803US95_155 [Synechococcus phage ACG-2014d]
MNLNELPDMTDALRQVYEKKNNDGNLANNAVPYDKVTKADIITGAKGKDEQGGKKKPKGHDCAKQVKYEGKEYSVIPEAHTLLEDGTVTHYDIEDEEYIYENVPVEDLEILISEKHEHFANYDKNAEVLGEAITSEKGKAKLKSMLDARTTAAGRAKSGKGQNVKDIQHIGRANVDGLGGTPPNRKTAKNPIKSRHYGGTGNKAAKRADALTKKEEVEFDEAMSSYDKNRKRAAQRAADRNAARAAGKTGVVPGVGYVTARKEKETYTDEKGTVRHKSGAKNEAFAFSEADFAELETLGAEIDALTDEQLIDVMEEIILEMAQDDQDLIEICEHLETVEVLDERMDPKEIQRRRDQAKDRLSTGASMKKAAAKSDSAPASAGPSRMDRLKSAAKKAGSAIKSGAKKVGKKAVQTAGKVAGEFSASKEKQKSASMEREPKEPKEAPKKSSGVTRSTVPSSNAGGGGSSSGGGSSESGSTRKAVGGALRKVGSLLKKGVKKAVGKTSRLVSKGSDKLAKRLGEEYDEIASLYESGLFTIEEIENIVEEKKPLPKNKMFRKAGNLGREVVSPSVTDDQRQKAYDRSKKIVKTLNKENQK